MGRAGAAPPYPGEARETEAPHDPRDPKRRLLRAEERLPVADVADGLPALEDRLPLLQEVAHRRDLGADEPRPAPATEGEARPGARAQRGDRRRAVHKDDRAGGEQRGFDGNKK